MICFTFTLLRLIYRMPQLKNSNRRMFAHSILICKQIFCRKKIIALVWIGIDITSTQTHDVELRTAKWRAFWFERASLHQMRDNFSFQTIVITILIDRIGILWVVHKVCDKGDHGGTINLFESQSCGILENTSSWQPQYTYVITCYPYAMK